MAYLFTAFVCELAQTSLAKISYYLSPLFTKFALRCQSVELLCISLSLISRIRHQIQIAVASFSVS